MPSPTSNLELYRRGQVPGLPESAAKYLQQELAKLEKAAASNFDRFEQIAKDVSGNASAIDQERETRADETGSLARQLAALSATSARVSTFTQGTAPADAVEGDIWINTSDNNKLNIFHTATGWVETSDVRISQNSAAISSEQIARQNADAALSTSITSVNAAATRQRITRGTTAPSSPQVGDLWIDTSNGNLYKYWNGTSWVASDDLRISQNASAITAEQSARAAADSAMSTRVDQVEANSNSAIANVNSRVTDEVNARTDFQTSMTSRVTTVESSYGKQRVFRQGTQPTAYWVGDLWFNTLDSNKVKVWDGTAWQDTNNPKIDANSAAISQESDTRAQEDHALGVRIDNVNATVGQNSANITQLFKADTDNYNALSSMISNVDSKVGGNQTSITQLTESVNGIKGRYGVTIDNNGYVSGISLISDASNGHPTSAFRITADQFAIRTPGASTDSIYWDGTNLVVRGNVLATSVQAGAVSKSGVVLTVSGSQAIGSTATTYTMPSQTAGTLTCSGGNFSYNLAAYVTVSIGNVNATTVFLQATVKLNGVSNGLPIQIYAPVVKTPSGRAAYFAIPMLYTTGAKSGDQTMTVDFYASWSDVNGNPQTAGSASMSATLAGYLQELKA